MKGNWAGAGTALPMPVPRPRTPSPTALSDPAWPASWARDSERKRSRVVTQTHVIAAYEYLGSSCAVLAEHDAEWVTDGVGEDSKARLTLTVHARGAEREQLLLGLVGIADANVEVQLLRMGRHCRSPASTDPAPPRDARFPPTLHAASPATPPLPL